MSTGKQLSLWSGMTEAQQNHVFHKTKVGKRNRIRVKQKCVTLNQALIVKMRKELRPSVEIAKHLQIDATTVRNFLVKAFGDKDPLDLHVLDSFNGGESAMAIGRRLSIKKYVICRILKKQGIDVWKAYLERESQSFRETGVTGLRKRSVRNPNRPRMIAEDLYCFWVEIGSIEEVAIETGWSPSHISRKLNEFIPKYKTDSESRRGESKDNEDCLRQHSLSSEYRTERDFVEACLGQLDGLSVTTNVRGSSSIEIDILVVGRYGDALIECKVRSRKPDLCKALGQAIINGATYERPSRSFICLPNDNRVYDSFGAEAEIAGVTLCRFNQLRECVCKYLISLAKCGS